MLIRHTMAKLSARQNNMMSIYGHGLTAQSAVEPKGRNVLPSAVLHCMHFTLCRLFSAEFFSTAKAKPY